MPLTHSVATAPNRLDRTTLLGNVLPALDRARALDHRAKTHPHKHNAASPRTALLRAHLDAQRHLVARRAASVALTPSCTDTERQLLRDATRRLVAITGALARHVGDVGRMN